MIKEKAVKPTAKALLAHSRENSRQTASKETTVRPGVASVPRDGEKMDITTNRAKDPIARTTPTISLVIKAQVLLLQIIDRNQSGGVADHLSVHDVDYFSNLANPFVIITSF